MGLLAAVAAVEWSLDYAMGTDLVLRGLLDVATLAERLGWLG